MAEEYSYEEEQARKKKEEEAAVQEDLESEVESESETEPESESEDADLESETESADLDEDLEAALAALESDDGVSSDVADYLAAGDKQSAANAYADSVASEDVKTADEMTEEELAANEEALALLETTIGTKTMQDGEITYEEDGTRYDTAALESGEYDETLGGTITENEDGTYHYEGSLGTFDYDTDDWAVGTKEITDSETGVTTTIPVLRYIGSAVRGNNIDIPDGVEVLDYTFEGTDVKTVPVIPDSVTSAHCAFKDCESLTGACKDAKEGEVDAGTSVGIGAVAAGAAAGAGIGAAAGVIGAVPGVVIGAAGGFLSGVTIGTGVFNDGEGGTWEMPDTLEDASGMFYGSSITEAYTSGGESLKATYGMYQDTELGEEEIKSLADWFEGLDYDYSETTGVAGTVLDALYWSGSNLASLGDWLATGGTDVNVIQDDTDTLVSDELAEDMYTGTAVSGIADDLPGQTVSKYWDDETNSFNTGNEELDAELMEIWESKAVQDANDTELTDTTDMYAFTDGAISYYTDTDEDGNEVKVTDVTAGNEEEEDSDTLDWASLIDRGLVSIGEYAICKAITKNTLLSIGITAGGQLLGILPTSMQPILETVASFVGEDSAIGQALNQICDYLYGENPNGAEAVSTLNTENLEAEADPDKAEGDDTYTSMQGRVESDLSVGLKATVYSDEETSRNKTVAQMYYSGTLVADDDVMLTAANKSGFSDLESWANLQTEAVKERVEELAGEDGELDDKEKEALAEQCKTILAGMQAYSDGVQDETNTRLESGDTTETDAAATEVGLEKTMSAATEPFLAMMQELDEEYDIFTDEDIAELDSYEIAGVPSYSEYTGCTVSAQAETAVKETEDNNSSDSGSDETEAAVSEEALYDTVLSDADLLLLADIGTEDETEETESEETESEETESEESEETESALTVSQELSDNIAAASGISEETESSTSDRGKEAEERFGSILSAAAVPDEYAYGLG